MFTVIYKREINEMKSMISSVSTLRFLASFRFRPGVSFGSLPLHPPVLEPDFDLRIKHGVTEAVGPEWMKRATSTTYLSLCEVQRHCDLVPSKASQVV